MESSIALVLLGAIIYLFVAGGLPLTGNIIATPNSENINPGDISSGDIVEPNPSQVFIYVLNTVPSNSSYNQGLYRDIVVTFSEQMLSYTVNSHTFIVRGPNNIALDGTITSDFTGRVWTFNPTDTLKSNTLYTITLTTGVRGVSENTLFRNYVFDFTTHSYSGGGGGSTSTPAPLVLTEITLTPSSRNISPGNAFQLDAVGLDQNSNQFNTTINYTSSNLSVANVSSSGLVTALSLGNTTITASNGIITDSSLVIVVEAILSSIEFSSSSGNISVGNDLQLNVSSYDQNQDPIIALINYTSSNESVATVNSTGFVTTLLSGNTTITASNGSINDTFVLNVFEAILTSINLTSPIETLVIGNTTQLISESFDQFNFPMSVVIAYNSSNESVANVSSSGLVTALSMGNTTITASNGTISNNVTINVYFPVLTRIDLTPSSTILQSGESIQLDAESFDQNNNTLSVVIAYNSSNESVATVNSTGFVNATGIGNATITAFNDSVTDTSLVTVVAISCPAVSVDLLTAGDYAIFAGTAIGKDGTAGTLINGDIGVGDGVTSTAITGFSLSVDPTNDFSTSIYVIGEVYAADYTGGQMGSTGTTPAKVLQAISDIGTIFTTANGLAACVTELGAGNIGGMTLSPGVYKWGSSTTVLIPTDLYLSGSATDVWVFQIGKNMVVSSSVEVHLTGGALAKNVFWIVTETTTLNSDSIMNGNIISGPGTSTIALMDRATLNGRALSGTDVTLIGNPVTKPTG
ncbi:hypothetical protein COU58_03050 [Candidatus Pacearchaeota archaeon CG10_big_fil_rev_8_21_14_0_10_32_42]|nr:MAG: hypothetical protein COU58_03050 [Candidatus Pacearchaeota archaeon CG10_big_fil_rev_8_21_14_0_10_32_42]